MTPEEALHRIEFNSNMICEYLISKRRWGCGTLEGCREGDQCDVLDHMADLWRRHDEARLVIGQ